MKKILISGATGLVGSQLARKLKERGFLVELLVRNEQEKKESDFKSYIWDYQQKFIEKDALFGVYIFIHLAGAGIQKRWTNTYKKEIIQSRVDSARFILDEMKKNDIHPEAVISASAVGYYGQRTTPHIFQETDAPGTDFLARVCQEWEMAALQFSQLGSRVVRIRTASVLSNRGGVLEVLQKPMHLNLGAVLGNGSQYFPWIHIDDLVGIYTKAVEDVEWEGAYNAAAPEFVGNKELTHLIAKKLDRKIILPRIPEFFIRAVLGEMSDLILKGSRVSSEKVIESGYEFRYPVLDRALDDLM